MISIIIPVYNGERHLNNMFDSILLQSYMDFEVIFVDNNSNDSSAVMIKNFIEKNKKFNIKYLFFDKKASSYAARNYGVKHSSGNILAFTDSDCILDKKWLEEIKKLKLNDNRIVSGHIELYFENKNNIWENFDKIVHMRNDVKSKKKEAATANLVISKNLFLKLNGFEEVVSGGDFSFVKKAFETGVEILFEESLVVYHPTRKTYEEIEKKLNRLAYGEGQLYKKNNKSILKGIFKNIMRVLNLPKNINISKKMIKNVGLKNTIIFNFKYSFLKIKQIGLFISGYKYYTGD